MQKHDDEALVSKLQGFAALQDGGRGRRKSVGFAYEYLDLFPPSRTRRRENFNLKLEMLSLQLHNGGLEVSREVLNGIETLQPHPVIIALLKLANSSSITPTLPQSTSALEVEQWWKGHSFRMVGNRSLSLPPPPMQLLHQPTCLTIPHAFTYELSPNSACKPIATIALMLEQCSTTVAALQFPVRLQNTYQRHAEHLIAQQRLEIKTWLMENYTNRGRMQLERFARSKIQDIRVLSVALQVEQQQPSFCALVDRLDVLCHEHCNAQLASIALGLFTRAKYAIEFDVLHRFLVDYSAFALDLPACLGGKQMAERCGKCKVLMLRYELKRAESDTSIEAYCKRMEFEALELCRTNLLQRVLPALEQTLIFNIEAEEDDDYMGKGIKSTLLRIRQCRRRFQLMCYERFHFFQAIEVFILNRLAWEFFPLLEEEIALHKSTVWELECLVQTNFECLTREPWNSALMINVTRPENCLQLARFREARNQFVRFLIQLESISTHPAAAKLLLQSLDANGFHSREATL